jgi:hypothetical protein
MQRMAEMTATPLASFSHDGTILRSRSLRFRRQPRAPMRTAGMIKIPGGSFDFTVQGVEIEGGLQRHRRRCAISVGADAAPLS